MKNGKSAVSGAYLNISTGYGTPASVNAGQTITGISNGTAVTRSLNFTEDTLYLNIAGNIQDILDNYDIMLATSNIPYEPYVGNSYRVDLGGDNLIQNNMTSQTINGLTFTINEDKSIKVVGTATARTEPNLWTNANLTLKANTNYYNNSNTAIYFYGSYNGTNGYFILNEIQHIILMYH